MKAKHLGYMLLAIVLLVMPSACSKKREDLKSPCVGAEDSPCGPRRPVNDWWMHA